VFFWPALSPPNATFRWDVLFEAANCDGRAAFNSTYLGGDEVLKSADWFRGVGSSVLVQTSRL